jgi:Glutamate/Leucine/Phenylalanine/Valine dehydrogenase
VPKPCKLWLISRLAGGFRASLNGPEWAGDSVFRLGSGGTLKRWGWGNAGGVTVSFFEWVQNMQRLRWEEHEISTRLGMDPRKSARIGLS